MEVWVQSTAARSSGLCPPTTSRVSFLREDFNGRARNMGETVHDSLEHQPMLKNLLTASPPPSSAFPVPAEPVNPYKRTVRGRQNLRSGAAVSFV